VANPTVGPTPAQLVLNDGDFQLTNNTAKVQPVSLGGRFGEMAKLFQKWRIRSGKYRYVPSTSMSGVLESPTIASPQYSVCQLVMGIVRDPGLSVGLTFGQAVDTGGKPFSSVRPATYNIKPTGWLYTADPTSTTTNLTDRFNTAGVFYIYGDANQAAQITLGAIYLDIHVEFSYPVPLVDDARASLHLASHSDEEAKFIPMPIPHDRMVRHSVGLISRTPNLMRPGPEVVEALCDAFKEVSVQQSLVGTSEQKTVEVIPVMTLLKSDEFWTHYLATLAKFNGRPPNEKDGCSGPSQLRATLDQQPARSVTSGASIAPEPTLLGRLFGAGSS